MFSMINYGLFFCKYSWFKRKHSEIGFDRERQAVSTNNLLFECHDDDTPLNAFILGGKINQL